MQVEEGYREFASALSPCHPSLVAFLHSVNHQTSLKPKSSRSRESVPHLWIAFSYLGQSVHVVWAWQHWQAVLAVSSSQSLPSSWSPFYSSSGPSFLSPFAWLRMRSFLQFCASNSRLSSFPMPSRAIPKMALAFPSQAFSLVCGRTILLFLLTCLSVPILYLHDSTDRFHVFSICQYVSTISKSVTMRVWLSIGSILATWSFLPSFQYRTKACSRALFNTVCASSARASVFSPLRTS